MPTPRASPAWLAHSSRRHGRRWRAQGQCGSCWAVAATGILGDRFCVHKAEFDAPIALPGDGAGGSGGLNRVFQFAGNCARQSDSVRNHGCRRKSVFPSPQALISCGTLTENSSLYPQDAGCNGGNAFEAWCVCATCSLFRGLRLTCALFVRRRRFYRLTGAPPMDSTQTTGCVPYTSGACVTPGGDPNNDGCRRCAGLLEQCEDPGLPPPSYKVATYGMLNQPPLPERDDPAVDRPPSAEMAAREANIMRELYTNGPLLGCIFDYHNFVDFFNLYPLGVYNSTEGSEPFGGHCMNIVGWGVDASSGMKYWLMRNTWGPGWGSNGIVRFRRGVDFLGIESDVWAACPAGAAHCQLTPGVDTSAMELPDNDGPDVLAAIARTRSRGGGHWREQAPESRIATQAAAEYLLTAGAASAEEARAFDAGALTASELLAAHGVRVRAAASQVVAGFKVRLELEVPQTRVGPLAADHPPVAAPNAVRLLPPPAGGPLGDIVNNGCDMGAACDGRSSTHSNGLTFCCKAGCGSSCSISTSSYNGNVRASCACSATLRVELLHAPDGAVAPHGVALQIA